MTVTGQGLTLEKNVDYPGSDFNRTLLSSPDPHICKMRCYNNSQCRAYTYVKPGIQGDQAVCFLKEPRPPTANPRLYFSARHHVSDCCVSGISSAAALTKSTSDDLDGDGLPDQWENEHRSWGLGPWPDLIIVPVLRPEISEGDVSYNLDMVKEFFESVPITDMVGQSINVVIRPGRQLGMDFSNSASPIKSYLDARIPGMPPELVGYAHGLFIDTSGGGQTSSVDWSGVQNNWQVMVHELGHQFGLDHWPIGRERDKWSPIYTSLMNYNYNYSFYGDPLSIHFSRGNLSGLRLSEDALDENLPIHRSRMNFLSKAPYNFTVELSRTEATGSGASTVDFNRNGILREQNVNADINDGYSVELNLVRDNLNESHGDIALASMQGRLILLTTRVNSSASEGTRNGRATKMSPRQLRYRIINGSSTVGRGSILNRLAMTGSPDTLIYNNQLIVSYPTENDTGFTLKTFALENETLVEKASRAIDGASNLSISLFQADNKLYVLVWDRDTKAIQIRRIINLTTLELRAPDQLIAGRDDLISIQSESPPSAIFNNKTNKLWLAVTDNEKYIQIHRLDQLLRGRWSKGGQEMKLGGFATKTNDRVELLFDSRRSAGVNGRIFAQFRRFGGDNEPKTLDVLTSFPPNRQGSGLEQTFVYRRNQLNNQWTVSRSPSAITFHNEDVYVALRKANNFIVLFNGGDGIWSNELTDFDDVGFIATEGLRRIETLR